MECTGRLPGNYRTAYIHTIYDMVMQNFKGMMNQLIKKPPLTIKDNNRFYLTLPYLYNLFFVIQLDWTMKIILISGSYMLA